MNTNLPFVRNNTINYASFLRWMGNGYEKWAWLIFIPFVIIIITAVSNAANLTDGLDGLATGVSAIIVFTLGVFAYISGNVNFADYLQCHVYSKHWRNGNFLCGHDGCLHWFLVV